MQMACYLELSLSKMRKSRNNRHLRVLNTPLLPPRLKFFLLWYVEPVELNAMNMLSFDSTIFKNDCVHVCVHDVCGVCSCVCMILVYPQVYDPCAQAHEHIQNSEKDLGCSSLSLSNLFTQNRVSWGI